MHPKLEIQKIPQFRTNKLNSKKPREGYRLDFIIVDAEIQKLYPQNFVCVLPLDLHNGREFKKIFENPRPLAIQLLQEALAEYSQDSDIKKEIEKRLYDLEPKLTKGICRACGEEFEFIKKGFKKKYCTTCRNKWLVSLSDNKIKEPENKIKFCKLCGSQIEKGTFCNSTCKEKYEDHKTWRPLNKPNYSKGFVAKSVYEDPDVRRVFA